MDFDLNQIQFECGLSRLLQEDRHGNVREDPVSVGPPGAEYLSRVSLKATMQRVSFESIIAEHYALNAPYTKRSDSEFVHALAKLDLTPDEIVSDQHFIDVTNHSVRMRFFDDKDMSFMPPFSLDLNIGYNPRSQGKQYRYTLFSNDTVYTKLYEFGHIDFVLLIPRRFTASVTQSCVSVVSIPVSNILGIGGHTMENIPRTTSVPIENACSKITVYASKSNTTVEFIYSPFEECIRGITFNMY